MGKRVLIVDDEPDILSVTRKRVESAGYDVATAYTAEEAFKYLEKNTPDLILLDLLLPNMQGEDFCKKVKKDPKFNSIPVVLFTASAGDIPKVAQEVGADDYVMKPFEPEELLGKIKKFIG